MNDFRTLSLIREFEAFLYGGIPEGFDSVHARDVHPFSESHGRGGSIQDTPLHPLHAPSAPIARIQYDETTGEEQITLLQPPGDSTT